MTNRLFAQAAAIGGVLLAMPMLWGCDRPVSSSDAEAIAEDFATDSADQVRMQLSSRIDELEEKLSDQEVRADRSLEYARTIHNALDEERENRKQEIQALRDHYNDHLVRAHAAR